MQYQHTPVMLPEVLKHLNVKAGRNYVDCTLGGAGYTTAIARIAGKEGRVLALDLDPAALKNAKDKLKEEGLNNVTLVEDNFKNLKKVIEDNFSKDEEISGVVLDLGLSSFQLADEDRGFSFQTEAPLDMSFGRKTKNSSLNIINNYSQEDLTRIFKEYGEERYAYRIAKEIILQRRKTEIKTTKQLAEIVVSQYPKRHYYRINPATKVFQALRIETNEELKNLSLVLPQVKDVLNHTGRIVVVSFHSGEDRIVKHYFKNKTDLIPLTKRPEEASAEEKLSNPRSRSAKLRAAIKIVGL